MAKSGYTTDYASAYKELYPTQVKYCKTIDQALEGAGLCFIFTDWLAIKEFPPKGFEEKMDRAIVLDGRNCYSLAAAEAAGATYESMGRRAVISVG